MSTYRIIVYIWGFVSPCKRLWRYFAQNTRMSTPDKIQNIRDDSIVYMLFESVSQFIGLSQIYCCVFKSCSSFRIMTS